MDVSKSIAENELKQKYLKKTSFAPKFQIFLESKNKVASPKLSSEQYNMIKLVDFIK
jgi:hypothetical protein